MGRPAMLTVDDDPAVSRAVARDLRRRYGEQYQILRASSAAEALDALRELKLRGGRVAVMLADYRMPQMNGVEFLEQAMDLFPQARRCLLTAYADTDAGALSAPTTAEVAAAVGMSTAPVRDFYDLVIVGGGPAGLGAAVYGASEGLHTVLVERRAVGGQAGQSSRIENYLGFPDGVS